MSDYYLSKYYKNKLKDNIMKKNHIFLSIIITFALFLNSCELNKDSSDSDTDTLGTVTLSGLVVEASTGNAISGATIRISDGLTVKGTTTNTLGVFSATFETEEDVDLEIIGTRDGYLPDTTSVFAIIESVTQVPLLQLKIDETSNGGSGTGGSAASINLFSQSSNFIGVKESGALESAQIVFEVRDSSGVLIDGSSPIDLSFTFGATPNGGEYLFPASVPTNALGKASVTLNTGTIAGVVQVIATASIDGKIIKSKPILIAIYGGFPEQDLFYVACEKLNYPALGVIGYDIDFTAYAGDKYNNPVRPGTAVYFTTNFGIIVGSNLTGELGTTSVKLLTEPWPVDPTKGAGFFRVTASTADENLNTISAETVRLLSGPPNLVITPLTFDIPNGGSQSFSYTIADVNGNPMSEGQLIQVSIESEFIQIAGAVSMKFPDTQSKSWTAFSFTAFDTKADTVFVEAVNIEVSTSGPNSDLKYTIGGIAR